MSRGLHPARQPMAARAGGDASQARGMAELLCRQLGRRRRLLWPPSRDSAPLLILGWLALTAPLAVLLRQRKSRDIALVEERRREHALSSLANVIDNEELRLAGDAKSSPPPHVLIHWDARRCVRRQTLSSSSRNSQTNFTR